MKKNLLILSLLFAFSVVFAQQNKQSQISSSSVNARIETRAAQRTNGTQPAPTSTTSSCMSINYPTVTTWSPTIYSTGTAGAGGFVSGPNQYLDKEKAMYFDASASAFTKLYQVDVWFAKGYSSNPSKVVNMKIYDGTSGTPSTSVIATASLTMGTIMSDVVGNFNTSFYFPAGVTLPASKKFFCSVDLTNLDWTTSKDSLCIVSNQSGQTIPGAAWEKQSNSVWYPYSSTSAWTQSVSLHVHPFLRNTPVTATFSAAGPALCAGNSITYDATGSTTGGVTYWNFGASTSPTTASTNSISVLYPTAGTYTTTLLIFDACDALGAAQSSFTVNPKPTVSATPATTVVCSGSNITLNGGGATSYVWTGGATNGTSFAPANGNYTVTGTAANGCTNTAVASVTVNALPTVSVTSGAICNGNSFSITPSGANTFTISGGTFSVSPTTTTSYSVTGTSAQGCLSSNTAVSTVTVNNLPLVAANTTSTSICAGSNVTLTGGGATTYTWSNSVTNGTAFTPTSSNTYTVNGTDGNGCQNSATVGVSVNNLPVVTANTTSTSICVGSNVTLTGGGATTYTWDNSVVDATVFAPVYSNTYTVIGLDGNGCQNSATVVVNVNNLPSVLANTTSTLVCTGDNVVLTGSGGALTYTWTNGVVDGVGFAASTTNTYTVNGTDVNGCVGSATVEIVVSTCTGINNVSSKNSTVLVFPNPNNGEFTIQSYKDDVVSVINELGQTVKIVELNTINNYSSNITQLQNGVYFIIGKTVKQKVVVTK